MVATAKRKAERAKAFAEAQAKSHAQAQKNASKANTKQTKPLPKPDPRPPTEEAPTHDSESKPEPQPTPAKNHRFILFIGNLPFTATTPQISQHFASVNPSSIRHSTDKTTGKSKGFAFLEFDDYSRMTACIKNFHHSLFGAVDRPDDGEGGVEKSKKSKGDEGRRINVELTVGGGGSKSTARKMKLRAKNEKLSMERRKRAVTSKGESNNEGQVKEDDSLIHPSRRAKIAG